MKSLTQLAQLLLLLVAFFFSTDGHACSCVPVYADPCEVIENASQNPDDFFAGIIEVEQGYYDSLNRLVFPYQLIETFAGNPVAADRILETGNGANCIDFFDFPAGTRLVLFALTYDSIVSNPSFCSDYSSIYEIIGNSITYSNLPQQTDFRISIADLRNQDCNFVLGSEPTLGDKLSFYKGNDQIELVNTSGLRDLRVELYSMTGQRIATFTNSYNLAGLSAGVYVLVARREDEFALLGRFIH